ncbi:cell division protein ZapA [Erythrobacteraceae bacterium E2-1 Yellow Sea]|nr:cell division protein ZapA [Erythrobacteraceae bacterium E2-1 Yellow Sea]
MSEVALHIGGKTYMIACGDGEETHLVKLGKMIDAKLAAMDAQPGVSDVQNMLFAALFLADELDEAQRKLSSPAPSQAGLVDEAVLAPRLEYVAQLLENCADTLESKARAS